MKECPKSSWRTLTWTALFNHQACVGVAEIVEPDTVKAHAVGDAPEGMGDGIRQKGRAVGVGEYTGSDQSKFTPTLGNVVQVQISRAEQTIS